VHRPDRAPFRLTSCRRRLLLPPSAVRAAAADRCCLVIGQHCRPPTGTMRRLSRSRCRPSLTCATILLCRSPTRSSVRRERCRSAAVVHRVWLLFLRCTIPALHPVRTAPCPRCTLLPCCCLIGRAAAARACRGLALWHEHGDASGLFSRRPLYARLQQDRFPHRLLSRGKVRLQVSGAVNG